MHSFDSQLSLVMFLRLLTNHRQQHFESSLGVDSMWHVGRHYYDLSFTDLLVPAPYREARLAIENLNDGVVRCGMLAQLLALVKGEQCDCPNRFVQYRFADNRIG